MEITEGVFRTYSCKASNRRFKWETVDSVPKSEGWERSCVRVAICVCVIALVVVPWTSFRASAHWEHVEWIPFSKNPDLLDMTANALFYLPYGVLVADVARTRRRHPLAFAVTTAIALSAVGELTQVFSDSRVPAVSDVIANTVGAFVGSWWMLRKRRDAHHHSDSVSKIGARYSLRHQAPAGKLRADDPSQESTHAADAF
jgi:VanZ like family